MFKAGDDMQFEATLDDILYGATDFQQFEIATGMFDSYEISKNQVTKLIDKCSICFILIIYADSLTSESSPKKRGFLNNEQRKVISHLLISLSDGWLYLIY
jgi:hypothetical protein